MRKNPMLVHGQPYQSSVKAMAGKTIPYSKNLDNTISGLAEQNRKKWAAQSCSYCDANGLSKCPRCGKRT